MKSRFALIVTALISIVACSPDDTAPSSTRMPPTTTLDALTHATAPATPSSHTTALSPSTTTAAPPAQTTTHSTSPPTETAPPDITEAPPETDGVPTPPTVFDTPPQQADTATATEGVPPQDPEDSNYDVLYIGHSFGRPFANNLGQLTSSIGVDHIQHTIFRGGLNGTPELMWNNPETNAEIKKTLETGTIDMVVMVCCSPEWMADGTTDSAMFDIADYAIAQNPTTAFRIGMPWEDFPADHTNTAAHRLRTDAALPAWHALADNLDDHLGGADVEPFYHGAAIYELRAMFERGELPGVDNLIGSRRTSVFTDNKGHAGTLAMEVGTLIWLDSLFGIAPMDAPPNPSYDVDIRTIAATALDNSAHLWTG